MSPRAWARRDFLLSLGSGALTLVAGEGVWAAARGKAGRPGRGHRIRSAGRSVRMGCILPPGDAGRSSGTEAGILLGREESEQVAALLGVKLDVRVERVGGPEEVEASGARLLAEGVQVLVGAVEATASRKLNRTTSRAGVLFVDARPSSVAPSNGIDSPCALPAFRVGVEPATGMGLVLEALSMGASGGSTIFVGDPVDPQLVRAREALTRRDGDAHTVDASTPAGTLSDELRSLEEGGASGPVRVVLVGAAAHAWAFRPGSVGTACPVFTTIPIQPGGPLPVLPVHAPALWHPDLVRFGAAQLNERHERRFATPMDPSAWAGWFVVKLLWEVTLREVARRSGESLRERLLDSATRFDGHKGVGIGFRSDGLLRQPLYIVRTDPDGGSEVVHEGPVAPRETSFVAAFDGLAPPGSPCRRGGVGSAPYALPAP